MASQLSTINAQLLQHHFDTLAETPDAVPKLRALVLQLAVQGSLVPHSEAEPAVPYISAEKATPINVQQVPANWRVVLLADVIKNRSGNSKLIKGKLYDAPAPNLFQGFSASGPDVWCEEYENEGEAIIISAVGARCGKAFKASGKWSAIANTNIARAEPTLLDFDFAYLVLNNEEFWVRGGSAQPFVKFPPSLDRYFALPPLAEQRRIVAKVEELLALCDELEARQTAAREHRTRLVRSSLDHLTTAQSEPEFRQHAAFVLQHSSLILDSVPALRQAVIQLAVLGRLNEQMMSERVDSTSGENATAASLANEKTNGQALPPNWLWLRFKDVLALRHGHQFREYDFVPSGIPVIKIGQCKRDGTLDLSGCDYVAANRLDEFKDFRIEKHDILMALTGGTLGKVTVVDRDYGPVVQNYRVGKFIPKERLYTKGFTEVILLSGFFQTLVFEAVNQNAQPNIGKEKMEELIVPVPPLAEQQRIVAKVDELMRWCDALEARLTAAQTTATHLLDATLHQILTA